MKGNPYMTAKCFVDTNIWVYCRDKADPLKQSQAIALVQDLFREHSLVISVQVVSEFHEAMRRLLGATPELAVATGALLDLQPEPITADTIQGALDLFKSHSLSWWDSVILSSARKAGCHTIYSEDMQSGALIGGVKIVNPFHR